MAYYNKLKAILSPIERKVFARLNSPQKIQDYLDTLPINFELKKETYMSPRRVIREKTAHCFEGALFAATAFAYHGHKPLLLDLVTIDRDEDHVVAIFKSPPTGGGLWGAISKTNHPILRYRDPVYKTVRELAMSYFHEYMMDDGAKSLRLFSKPFNLSRYSPSKWITAEEDLDWLVEALDDSRHFDVAPKNVLRNIRKASAIEVKAINNTEWPAPKGKS
ncbi:MAG: hypothetical protein UX39_C0003G0043 [Candidatus Magasanikbacteria bacterium GW2011_GWA2_46_17]|uniref:Transglutaminase-like domain-containing protein n=2 Tax=Parcubacteria group TaxID=1794811 RepID=A0A0G1P2T0_9BACT|nr:MAG: hypothetical protein UX39_C0003G0043 [Candidatus Magasanikbacteria bacterium GW2011_GWA2_46_17]OGG60971.1 MAG: hypothetical protein A3C86_04450 [Candidatus Kaiserbacteria bacterium RIFCSPHIGHO2_02_FULL_49_16]